MNETVEVNERVVRRHPELSEEDVLAAWTNAIAAITRIGTERETCVAVGTDAHGRLLELIAARRGGGGWILFHALTPPTKKILTELGLTRR